MKKYIYTLNIKLKYIFIYGVIFYSIFGLREEKVMSHSIGMRQ